MKTFFNFGGGVKPACSKAFTLAETLIVIGIIGVVAALTLPNLNHATGDKEKVTRVKKIYSALTDANDRAVATYGALSEWNETCKDNFYSCWLNRVGEFMKTTKSCVTEYDEENDTHVGCEEFTGVYEESASGFLQLADGSLIAVPSDNDVDWGSFPDCNIGNKNICLSMVIVDIDGPNKGKNEYGNDIFSFVVSDTIGVMPFETAFGGNNQVAFCLTAHVTCTSWVVNFDNMDYLKADNTGKCNDNPSIVLDGVTNTSCH